MFFQAHSQKPDRFSKSCSFENKEAIKRRTQDTVWIAGFQMTLLCPAIYKWFSGRTNEGKMRSISINGLFQQDGEKKRIWQNLACKLLVGCIALMSLSAGRSTKTVTLSSSSPSLQLNIRASTDSAQLTLLGWDTEKTGRDTIDLLKSPVVLNLSKNGKILVPGVKSRMIDAQTIQYTYTLPANKKLTWEVAARKGKLGMNLSGSDDLSADIDKIELVFPFNPRKAVTSIISSSWTEQAHFKLPVIVSAPDIGQLLLTSDFQGQGITGYTEGSRRHGWIRVKINLPVPLSKSATHLQFVPVVLPIPNGFKDTKQWSEARRGWFNQIHQSCGASGGGTHVVGVWANNALSDPVSSLLYMLGDATVLVPELAPGVPMAPILRRSVEYFIDHKSTDYGLVGYTAGGTPAVIDDRGDPDPKDKNYSPGKHQMVMDGNPSVIIGAWSYVKVTSDTAWLRKRIGDLEFIARFLENRDVDGDGLIESKQSGNRGSRPPRNPDSAWDCYTSGHKNAYINILVYRAFGNLADLERKLGKKQEAEKYSSLAAKLKSGFVKTFYNAETGWLGWWRSQDGELHDIYSDVPTSLAITTGLVTKEEGRKMLQRYWKALTGTGFNRFDLGVPVCLRPIPQQEMEHYTEFQQFLNGGCCVSNTAYLLDGLYSVGMEKEADRILNAMLKRQKEGVYPNGGGFQNGFVDQMGGGAEVFDWKGNPAGYEGHLVYCWNFLHSMLLKEPSIRNKKL